MKRFTASMIVLTLLLTLFTGIVHADTIVYITDTGKKYHVAGCKYLNESQHSISLTEALKRGYTACKVCNAPVVSHTHSWNGGSVTTAATCVSAGVRTYTCTGCGITKTETIPIHTAAHAWNGGAVTTAPTCAKAGVRTYTCTRCSAKKTESISINPSAHTWNSGKITTAATCVSAGVRTYTCTGCGTARTETIPQNPTAHAWKCTEVLIPTEGDQHGYGTFVCQTCSIAKKDDICPSSVFVDVKNDWSHKSIDYIINKGITKGTDATHFSPDATCTRGQVVTFLWRAAGEPKPVTVASPFADVSAGAYYDKPVLWAVETGVTSGVGAGRFAPEEGCTRGQVVTFLWRSQGCPEPNSSNHPFADVTGDYYYKAVLWAVENGITSGLDANHFGPDDTCTRAQIVTFLYRFMK